MSPALLAVILGVPLALLAWYVRARGDGSEREDESELGEGTAAAAADELADSLGWPYFFGGGSPATPWSEGSEGVDCAGYAQIALVHLGLLSSSAPDRGAASLADDSNPIDVGDQEPGDLAYYPGHVMVVISYPGSNGHSKVMGASGGTATTFGDDPGAYVKAFDSALYRGDFVTYMRLRS